MPSVRDHVPSAAATVLGLTVPTGSIAHRRQDVPIEDRALTHPGCVGGEGVGVRGPVFFGEGAERDGSTFRVDVTAGQLGRFNGGEETLCIDAAV